MRALSLLLPLLLLTLLCGQCSATDLIIQVLLKNENVVLNAKTSSGHHHEAVLDMRSKHSVCNVPQDDLTFADIYKKRYFPVFDTVLSKTTRTCLMDMYFVFQSSKRYMKLSFDRLTFSSDNPTHIAESAWMQCDLAKVDDALCTVNVNGTELVFFGDTKVFSEALHSVHLDSVKLTPGDTWVTTTSRTVTVPLYQLLAHRDIYFDSRTKRVALQQRTPTLGLKIASSIFWVLLGIIFAARFLITTRWSNLFVKISTLAIAVAGIIVAFAAGTRSLSLLGFRIVISIASAVYLLLEIARYHVEGKEMQEDSLEAIERACMKQILHYDVVHPQWKLQVKPDTALILIAFILTIYAVSSHSMVIIPTLLVFVFTSKTVSEVVFARSNDDIYVISLVTDFAVVSALWRWVVAEFLETTSEGNWVLQIVFIVIVLIIAGVYLAALKHNLIFGDDDEAKKKKKDEEEAKQKEKHRKEEIKEAESDSEGSYCKHSHRRRKGHRKRHRRRHRKNCKCKRGNDSCPCNSGGETASESSDGSDATLTSDSDNPESKEIVPMPASANL